MTEMEKFDAILNWIANRILILILILFIIYLLVIYVYPFYAGQYEFFVKYHNSLP
jgi:hypothetical protein